MKTCSKILFKNWIDDVRRAYRRIPEIKEKIAFYESQLDGYHAVTYDSVRVKTYGNAQERNLIYIIQKIAENKSKLHKEQKMLTYYQDFKKVLDVHLALVLSMMIETSLTPTEICKRLIIKRARYYRIQIRLINLWSDLDH